MAQKRLNKTLVVAVALFGFAAILGLSALMLSRLKQQDPKYFVELGDRAAAESQWRQAAVFYHHAFERSRDPAHLVSMGEMLLNDGEIGLARGAWSEALVHQPGLTAAHEKRVQLLLDMADLYGTTWDALRESAQTMLDSPGPKSVPQEAFARHALGKALVNLVAANPDNAAAGIEQLQKASTLAPERAGYVIALAESHARQGRLDDAEKLYAQMIGRFDSPGAEGSEARRAYADFLVRRGKLDEAEKLFAESREFAVGDEDAVLESNLAYAAFLMQRWARAKLDNSPQAPEILAQGEKILRDMIQENPERFRPYLQLALLLKASSRFAEIVELTDQRLRQGLDRKGVKAPQNRVSAFTLMIYASEACVALGIEAGKSGDTEARDQWLNRAEQYVIDARGEAASHPRIASQSGRVKLARGQDRAGLEELTAADQAYRALGLVNWENKLILADAHLRLNEAGAARAVLEDALDLATRERGRDPVFWNLYAQSLFKSNELDRALAVADRVLTFDPQNRDARTIKAAVFERQNKPELASQTIEPLPDTQSTSALLRARAASLDGDSEKALKILREALVNEPGHVQLAAMAASELVNLKRHAEAEQIVADARKARPDDRTLAQLAVYARGDLSDADRDAAMLEVIQTEPDAYKRAVDLTMFHSRREDAAATLKSVNEALQHIRDRDTEMARSVTASQHSALLKTKIRAAGQLKDETALVEARDEAAKFDADGAGGKSVLGMYHMQRQEYELAINALREAVTRQPSDAASLTLLGQCYQTQGRTEEAKAAYERAVAVNRDAAQAHQGLAIIAKARGDEAAYTAALAVCERLSPNDPWVQEQVLVRTEDQNPQAAIARREALAQQSPDDLYNLQRLASLYEKAGDLAQAESKYLRLIELRPGDVRSHYQMAAFFRRTSRPQLAVEVLSKFHDAQPSGPEKDQAARLLANEYRDQNRLDLAEESLLSAAQASPGLEMQRAVAEFYLRAADDPQKAIQWYDRAIAQAEQSNSPLLPALIESRVLARLHRGVADFDGARADVQLLQRRFPDAARGSLWESEIYARTGDITQAVASLDDYLSERPDDVYALYQRARHRMTQGAIGPAIADLEAIKRVNPSALQHEPRILLGRLYRRTGRSELWIRELEAIVTEAPTHAAAVHELANAYIRSQRLSDADRLVTAQINREGADSRAAWYFLRGQISSELGQDAKALRDFEQAAAADNHAPDSVARVLSMYARLRAFEPGVNYFEGIRADVAPSAVVGSHYAMLLARAGRADQAVAQFRESMALALSKEPQAMRIVADNLQSAFPVEQAVALFQLPPGSATLARANDRLLVRIHAVAKQYDKAFALLDSLIASAATDSERAGLLHEKGTILQQAERYDDSVVAYEQALEYERSNWITLNNLAYVLSDAKRENERALSYAQRAVALADNSFTLDTLGWIYVGLGRYPEAVAELSRAIRHDPEYAWAYYHLGEAHRRAGHFEDATSVLTSGREVAATRNETEIIEQIDRALEKARAREST